MSIKKILLRIFIVLLLVIAAYFLITKGLYFDEIAKPKNVYGSVIDKISDKSREYIKLDSKYNYGNNFSINGDLKFELASEKYTPSSSGEDLKKYNLINNLNKSNITYNFSHDGTNKQLYAEIKQTIGNENIIYNKYLVDDATEYYFIGSILNNYVNNGSCNYFESLSGGDTTKENIDYLYEFIVDSLKNNLKDEYFEEYDVNEIIDDSSKSVKKITLSLNDKRIKSILRGILKDLKKDDKSNKILTDINEDFKNSSVNNKKKYLDSKETYTINIYTDRIFYSPLKYEVIHLNKDDKKTYSYEGNLKKGQFYFIDNDNTKCIGDILMDNKNISIDFKDNNDKNIGTFKFDKNNNNSNINLLFNMNNKSYDIVVSSKFINYSEKSYNNEIDISFKFTDELKTVLSGEIKLNNKIKSSVKIEEDTSNVILNSSLSEEQQEKRKNQLELVKERLEK